MRLLLGLGLLVGAVLLADLAARFYLQWRIEQSVQEAMPPATRGELRARVHGLSALWQLAERDFEHISLESDRLELGGLVLSGRVDGYGVALLDGAGMRQLSGSITLPAESVNALVQLPGSTSELRLGEGTVSYTSEVELFGTVMRVAVDASVAVQGDRLIVDASRVQVQGAGVDVDAAEWFGGSSVFTFPVCSAEHLPVGVQLTDVQVRPEGVTVAFSAQGLALDEATLNSRGSCRSG
ncbi:MAG: DUF2993 domain-containing protein [Pseudoclavibacter sp.]|nr:DUF2993 domain-containing protein [Pseudoclavibacter sp.]